MEVPLTKDQEKLLDEVAARMRKPRTGLAAEAIQAYLDHERWFRQQIEEAKASAGRGELVEHDEVVRRIERRFRDA